MSTYSTRLKIELIGSGEQSNAWGNTTNNNFDQVFEQSIAGRPLKIAERRNPAI